MLKHNFSLSQKTPYGESKVNIPVNPSGRDTLFKQDPSTRGDGGFQGFMVHLQEKFDFPTSTLNISNQDLVRAQRYAREYGNGGWETRLEAIFGDHLKVEVK